MAPGLSEGKRYEIVGMLKAGRSVTEVSKVMGVTRKTVSKLRTAYHERNGDLTRKSGQGRKPSKVTQRNIDALRKRVKREPRRSMRKLAKSMHMSYGSMHNLVSAAGLRSMRPVIRHDIMPGQEARRLERAKKLLAWKKLARNKDRNILWSDEKLFYVETHVNKKNDCFLVPVTCSDPSVRIIRRRKNPTSVMVFAAVSSDGQAMDPIIFPAGTNVNSKAYVELVLTKVKEFVEERFAPGSIVFQQNGAPAHTSNLTQRWLEHNLGKEGYWPKDMWPPSR